MHESFDNIMNEAQRLAEQLARDNIENITHPLAAIIAYGRLSASLLVAMSKDREQLFEGTKSFMAGVQNDVDIAAEMRFGNIDNAQAQIGD